MKSSLLKIFTTTNDKNLAFHITNNKTDVINARKDLCKKHNLSYDNLKYMNQVHNNDVQIVNHNQNLYTCDALITNLKNTPLMVMVADCIPLLFHDDIKNVIGVAHAGRNGTYLDISSNVIKQMCTEFNCDVKNIKVELGASIQKCCYEVSYELAQIARVNFGNNVVNNRNIDLQKINYTQLINIGILKENIWISNICTKCGNEKYYSYRKDNNCGRFAGLICLK
jgi:YfiH family protein